MPALNCFFLTFNAENVAYMHIPFGNIRYSPRAICDVICFIIVADVKCGLCEINKDN